MTFDEFMDTMALHFTMKHDDAEAAARWTEAYRSELKNVPPQALKKASVQLIRARKMRVFPMVSDILEAIETVAPPQTEAQGYNFPSQRAPDNPRDVERYRLAKEWRDKVCAQYGSMDAYLLATAKVRDDAGIPMASKRSTFKHATPNLSEPTRRMTGDA
jgi:hypothetical protein